MAKSIISAGIDTAKLSLDYAVDGNSAEPGHTQNNEDGWRIIAAGFKKAGVTRVGIEATGGYEYGVVAFLRKRGFKVIVLQPMQVKAYAKLYKKRAKSDKLDARLIAACTADLRDGPDPHVDERLDKLAAHLTYVEQIEEDITRNKIRLEHTHDARLKRMRTADIKQLALRRKDELKRIEAGLRAHDDLNARFDLVLSVQGVAERTAITMVVRMPELGSITREQAAALAGLAPFDNESGLHKGQRHIAGGRSRVRRSLFAAALPAAHRWNPALIDLYKRLTKAGKAHKVALIACARKILIYVNTVLQRGTPWVEKTKGGAMA
jgi:transposase